jgi:geranylgeranyl diphosphate synthase, type II
MERFLAYRYPLEAYMTEFFDDCEGAIYDPVRYILELGGKRMRPALLLGTAEALGTDPAEVMSLAAAIEVFHNFTLLHDDIMDEAPLRRGEDTVHMKWNRDQAILSGDIMFALSYDLMDKQETRGWKQNFRLFTRTAKEVCEGQQMDMDFEKRPDVEADEYLEMIRLKTSVLLGAAAAIGARAAGASEKVVDDMYLFGEQMGLAFQIQDDLLDAFSEEAEMGKHPGGDILQNKKTLLYIYAKELASSEDRETLVRWYALSEGGDEKVAEVRAIMTRSGALDKVKEMQRRQLHNAILLLDRAGLPSAWDKEFKDMIAYQTQRIK